MKSLNKYINLQNHYCRVQVQFCTANIDASEPILLNIEGPLHFNKHMLVWATILDCSRKEDELF